MRDERKKEASKVKQTNTAKQYSTPKAISFPRKNELPRVHVQAIHVYNNNYTCTCISYMYEHFCSPNFFIGLIAEPLHENVGVECVGRGAE